MNRVFVFVLAVFLAGCASIAQPPSAPLPLTWQHIGSMSYESRTPGLGVSQGYFSSAGKIDVYVYGLQRNDWESGVGDPQFAAHFKRTVDEVRLAAQHGLYTDLQIDADATRDVVVSDKLFRTICFRLSIKGRPMISAIYLTALNGQLLKYRVSIYTASGLDIAAVAQSFIEENLRSTTGALRAPIRSDQVEFYFFGSSPPKFEVIGQVSVSSDTGRTGQNSIDYAHALAELGKQAAKLGANGVLLVVPEKGKIFQGTAIFVKP